MRSPAWRPLPTRPFEVSEVAAHVTTLELEKIKAGVSRIAIACGLGLYYHVEPSDERSWHSRLRFRGKPINVFLGSARELSLKSARAKNAEVKAEAAAGIDPREEKRAARAALAPVDTVASVAERFLSQHVRRNLKAPRQVERVVAREILPFFGDRPMSEIRRADVYAFHDLVHDRSGPAAANRAVSWLGSLCSFAVNRSIIETSPCAGFRRMAKEAPRTRVLSDLELVGIWLAHESLGAPYDQFLRILVLTAQRKSEVSGMRFSELDLEKRLWVLPAARTKNSREHAVPLSSLAAEILEAMPRIGSSDFVFTVGGRVPISSFARMKRKIDAEMDPGTPWCLHDLRRTAAVGLQRLGVNLQTIEKILNHTSGSFAGIVSVYQTHDLADAKRAGLEAWSRYVDSLVNPDAADNVLRFDAGARDGCR